MPLPATTGSIKRKISDMEIGDYIPCNYAVTYANTVGKFSNLGTATGTEIPVTGLNLPNGLFYWVKINKGLLVSSTVLQHSISWDTLNTSKIVQGLPWDAGNIIPTMTSNTSPSGMASASSIYDVNYDAWKAFNSTEASGWNTPTNVKAGWLAYEFDNPATIRGYSIKATTSSADIGSSPKSWTLEGTNDNGDTWKVIDQRVNETGWTTSQVRYYMISSPKSFKKYRINVAENNGGTYVVILKMQMMETAGIIRSLTGGVVYADANGNKSTTDPSSNLGGTYGGWPINNEWDSLICSFSADKIQTGKTLDDIFHWSNCQTWTQDTPWNASTNRITRGANALRTFHIGYASNNVSSSRGFRPVFEYRE